MDLSRRHFLFAATVLAGGAIGTAATTGLSLAKVTPEPPVAIVFIGDSITYGAGLRNAGSMLSPTMPFAIVENLKLALAGRQVVGANKGVGGTTATDWKPGGKLYDGAVRASNSASAASVLAAANPGSPLVFSIMLGTNDSASAGTNNGGIAGLSAAQYKARMGALIGQILAVDWPDAIIVLHMSPWYSPNFRNSATYLQEGLTRLYSYRASITQLVADYQARNPGHVYVGDTQSFDYFAGHHETEQQAEDGKNGVFYCHPNAEGAATLGKLQADAIAIALKAHDLSNGGTKKANGQL